jgi:hypothetical protein
MFVPVCACAGYLFTLVDVHAVPAHVFESLRMRERERVKNKFADFPPKQQHSISLCQNTHQP